MGEGEGRRAGTKSIPVAIQCKVRVYSAWKNKARHHKGSPEWSSHMVTVVEKDDVQIYLDRTALNTAQLRENYVMPNL